MYRADGGRGGSDASSGEMRVHENGRKLYFLGGGVRRIETRRCLKKYFGEKNGYFSFLGGGGVGF